MMAQRTKVSDFSAAKVAAYFEYLDALRKSGVTNMYGAAPYLMDSYNLNRNAAVSILSAWMKSFGDGSAPAKDRAIAALANHPETAVSP